jgi:hypothetical protein
MKKGYIAEACAKAGFQRITDVGCSDVAVGVVLEVTLNKPSNRNCAAAALL